MKSAYAAACFIATSLATEVTNSLEDRVQQSYTHYKDNQILVNDTNPFTSVNVEVDGKTETMYIAAPFWFTGGGEDGKMQIPPGGRAYLSFKDSVEPEQYFSPNLLGATVEYDVDLSIMGCGCVAALYLVSMPARNEDGSFNPSGDSLYYCDANAVGGALCPEFDIMEAN